VIIAPKSYDKLPPLVALPSRSAKPIVPELGYRLPSEIQGFFSEKFKPSLEGSGLDSRRREAKDLLDVFDKAMKALGKRRPKYTEYPRKSRGSPHGNNIANGLDKDAFKEQLKADEAIKTKAEKQARRLAEEERSKPVRIPSNPMNTTRLFSRLAQLTVYSCAPRSAQRTLLKLLPGI
jgi:hypothetical protein